MQSDFEFYLESREIHPFVIQAYLDDLANFSCWFEENYQTGLKPEKVNPSVRDAFRQYLEGRAALNRIIVDRKLQMLRAYSAWGYEIGEVEAPLKNKARWSAKRGSQVQFLDALEQEALMMSLQNAYSRVRSIGLIRRASLIWALIVTLLHGGLLAGEIATLEIKDILVVDQKIDIRVKGRKRDRIVSLDESAWPALQSWIEARPDWNENTQFFVSQRGHTYHCDLVRARVAEAGRRAGLVVTPLILRETFIKNKLEAGVSPDQVAVWLGHPELNLRAWHREEIATPTDQYI